MLREYDVEYVFGLPGETTLPLYVEWLEFKDVGHVMFRDERNACFAADGYARVSYKPGICEAPSAGAAHILPAIVEAYASSLPTNSHNHRHTTTLGEEEYVNWIQSNSNIQWSYKGNINGAESSRHTIHN
jgi:glyoxylate carboligase